MIFFLSFFKRWGLWCNNSSFQVIESFHGSNMFSCSNAMMFAFVVKPVLAHWWGWGELSAVVTHQPPVILSLCMLPWAFRYCTEGRSKHYRVSDSFLDWEGIGDGPQLLQQDNSIRLCGSALQGYICRSWAQVSTSMAMLLFWVKRDADNQHGKRQKLNSLVVHSRNVIYFYFLCCLFRNKCATQIFFSRFHYTDWKSFVSLHYSFLLHYLEPGSEFPVPSMLCKGLDWEC